MSLAVNYRASFPTFVSPVSSVTPIPHPHVHGIMLKGANVHDSKDKEGGRKEQLGFVILQQKLNREVKRPCKPQEHNDLLLSCPEQLKLQFLIRALIQYNVIGRCDEELHRFNCNFSSFVPF